MKITDLKILNQTNPVGIGDNPYFSWKIENQTPETKQVSYQITVKDAEGTTIMETGRKESDETSFHPYEGKPLMSRSSYSVSVSITDNYGEKADAEAVFETALLHENDWTAKWAAAPFAFSKREKGFGRQAPASMFRKSFNLNKPIKKARLYATCHGIYRVSVNGSRPDQRELAPEYTFYDKYLCYQTYDITDLLNIGTNVIGMMVGDGWYFSPALTKDPNTFFMPHAVLFQAEIIYEDNTYETVASDSDVSCARGPVLSSDLFGGESYDSRLESEEWDTANGRTENWIKAVVTDYGYQNLVPQQGEPVVITDILPSLRSYISDKGEYIVDFGQNFAGKPRITVNEPAGVKIRLDLFEMTDTDGNYFNTILSAGGVGEGVDQRIEFISSGKKQTYAPFFTYSGFRYAKISGVTNPEEFTVDGLVLSTRKDDSGSFSCSDADINRLISNIRWSQRSNMISIPTDCPQREKGGWCADISLYAKTAMQNEDCTNLLTRWLDNARAEQGDNGAIPMLVPYPSVYHNTPEAVFGMEAEEEPIGVAGWGDAIISIPWTIYEITGNKEILKQNYDAMRGWCDYILSRREERGDQRLDIEADRLIWNSGFQFGEWLIPSTTKDGTLSPKAVKALEESSKYTTPIFGWRSFHQMFLIADCLGRRDDAEYYRNIAGQMKNVISSNLITADGNLLWDYMGAYVLLLYFDMALGSDRQMCEKELIRRIHANGDCLDTGFLATPFLLPVLEKMGRLDLAYTILLQEKEPSWLFEVKNGATTIWEAWNGLKEDGNPQNISFNHYAFGAVASWIYETIGGLSSDTPGYRHAVIAPKPCEKINSAERSFNSINGWYRVRWNCEGNIFHLDVDIPCNCDAVVILPDGTQYQTGSGKYSYTCILDSSFQQKTELFP